MSLSNKKKTEFRNRLLGWYHRHERPLPWKDLEDPYLIWVSEIMLQQTRAAQAWDYFLRFTDRFPCVEDLAEASEDEVLSHWKGLGYYARARNLHEAARYIVRDRNSAIPGTYEGLLDLKGVGPYTASAIASFAFGEARAVLDGNVHRVLSRYMGWEKGLHRAQDKRTFQELADDLIDQKHPGMFNQAMMDLGAVICSPGQPLCDECPLAGECVAKTEAAWDRYPPVRRRPDVKSRFFHYFICTEGDRFLVRKRREDDIWKGLYEFPLRESEDNRWFSGEELRGLAGDLLPEHGNGRNVRWACFRKMYSQRLSHQKIHVRFYLCLLGDSWEHVTDAYEDIDSFAERALPRIIDCFLEDNYIYLKNLSI